MWNRKELGSGNAECGMEKKWEVGMGKLEFGSRKKRLEQYDLARVKLKAYHLS
jgi:hypothetical protein